MSLDLLVPIVFPDYRISTPIGKIEELGHAGMLLIDGASGTTKYFEYGRYDEGNLGLVRRQKILGVVVETSGQGIGVTRGTLAKTLADISSKSGQSGRILAAIARIQGGYPRALDFANKQMGLNTDPKRKEYNLLTNNCMHFVKRTLEAAGLATPLMIDPRPNSYIDELRDEHDRLDFDPKTGKLVIKTSGRG